MKTNVLVVSLVAMTACDHPDVELPGNQFGRYDGDGPTWNEVYPIFQNNCVTCHRGGQLATYKPLDTYEAVLALADEIALRVLDQADRGGPMMPPFTPDSTETCSPAHVSSNDPALTEQEITDIVAWVDEGAPHGNNGDLPDQLIPPAVATLSNAIEYPFTEGVTISIVDDDMEDVFRCIVVDPGVVVGARWLSGIQLNPDVDHLFKSARIMLDRGRESLQYVADDSPRTHGATWYDCNDGFGFEGDLLATFLAGTAPPTEGSVAPGGVVIPPFEMPPGSAMAVPGDAVIVARILYHPHWDHLDPGIAEPITEELSWVDHTSVSLRWESRRFGSSVATLFHFGNDTTLDAEGTGLLTEPFDVPAGDPVIGAVPHTEIMAATIPGGPSDSYAVWSVTPSMGRWGSTIEIKAMPADGGEEQCLGAVSDWNVSFQSPIRYSEEVDGRPVVHGGDIVTATCTYLSQSLEPLVLDEGPEQERCEATLGLVKTRTAVLVPLGG